jgi:hypothetical protein
MVAGPGPRVTFKLIAMTGLPVSRVAEFRRRVTDSEARALALRGGRTRRLAARAAGGAASAVAAQCRPAGHRDGRRIRADSGSDRPAEASVS